MNYASTAYAKTAKEVAAPRELEASLLLKAAAKLQAVYDSWAAKPSGFDDAVQYNRRLWIVFLDSVNQNDARLPPKLRENLSALAAFVLCETYSLLTTRQPRYLASLITINRRIAAGLRGRASAPAAARSSR